MEETNFVLLWKEQYEKIDQSLAINKQLLKEVISQKAASALQSLIRYKTRGIVAVIAYLLILGIVLSYAVSHYSSALNYFIISMAAIFLINLKALFDYIRHLVWIKNIDYDGSITEIQEKLSKLQLSIVHHSRFMVLQIPFWTTFQLSDIWFPHDVSWGYIIFQVLLTFSFTLLAYWLYKNLTLENTNKKWVKSLIEASGGRSILKAIAFYKELETFKLVD
jgi:lysylphosphatidylglycerol synthetase-like protein (DUF2156 family)